MFHQNPTESYTDTYSNHSDDVIIEEDEPVPNPHQKDCYESIRTRTTEVIEQNLWEPIISAGSLVPFEYTNQLREINGAIDKEIKKQNYLCS